MQMKKIISWRSDVEMKTLYEITVIKNWVAIIFFLCRVKDVHNPLWVL